MEVLEKHKVALNSLCRKHHVDELYAIGSVLKESFSKDSDIDLLVKFGQIELAEYFDNYMDLKEALEKVLKRSVDLVEVQTVKNPILKNSIERSTKLIYGRKDSEMVV